MEEDSIRRSGGAKEDLADCLEEGGRTETMAEKD
jgi:hypothetical protein